MIGFFFNDAATPDIHTCWHSPSLHDALPICRDSRRRDDIGLVNGLILKAGSGVEQLLECILIRNDVIVHGPDEVRASGITKLETQAEPARRTSVVVKAAEIGRASCRERVCKYV